MVKLGTNWDDAVGKRTEKIKLSRMCLGTASDWNSFLARRRQEAQYA